MLKIFEKKSLFNLKMLLVKKLGITLEILTNNLFNAYSKMVIDNIVVQCD